MLFPNLTKHLMLDAMDEAIATGWKFGSLHTAYSATGANEVTGGSPAYARKATTWAAAASGAKAMSATFPVWDVPASTTVAWIGLWDAVSAGNFLGIFPAGGGTLRALEAESGDLAGDTIASKAHGFTAGQAVVFWQGAGGTLPAPLAVGTIYYVIAAGLATDVFKVSTTSGGAALDITATGGGFAQLIIPEVFAGQGTYTLSSCSIDLAAVA